MLRKSWTPFDEEDEDSIEGSLDEDDIEDLLFEAKKFTPPKRFNEKNAKEYEGSDQEEEEIEDDQQYNNDVGIDVSLPLNDDDTEIPLKNKKANNEKENEKNKDNNTKKKNTEAQKKIFGFVEWGNKADTYRCFWSKCLQ